MGRNHQLLHFIPNIMCYAVRRLFTIGPPLPQPPRVVVANPRFCIFCMRFPTIHGSPIQFTHRNDIKLEPLFSIAFFPQKKNKFPGVKFDILGGSKVSIRIHQLSGEWIT